MTRLLTSLVLGASLTACAAQAPETELSVLTMASEQSFDATEASLRKGLAARNLKLFAVVDHGSGAKSIDQDIGQSKLFIFGNPQVGTPLMIAESKLGLELPMKILIENKGDHVELHRPNVAATIRHYGVTDQEPRLVKIDQTLTAIMTEAAGG